MGQAKTGELERAARLGIQVRAVRNRDITPSEAGGLLAARPGWLIAEQERRQAQTEREAQGRLRRELADALVTSVHEAWLQELKHVVSDADAAAIDARWTPEIGWAKQEARQLAGELPLSRCGPASAGNGTPPSRRPATVPASCCGGHWGTAVARFEIPEGWCVQAFCFALDPSPEQAACLRRHFGGRRHARNWAVRTLKADLDRYHATGEETAEPSLAGLRKRWNRVKDDECVDAETGQVWWPQVSKEAFADGINGAVDGYWNWQTSRAGKRAGKRVGFPRFTKKGRDRDRVTFTTGAIRVEPDRRHVTLPGIGTVRVHENTRRLERLTGQGSGADPRDHGVAERDPADAACRVLSSAPSSPGLPCRFTGRGRRRGAGPRHRRRRHGEVIERVPNPRPARRSAEASCGSCRRERSRRTRGSPATRDAPQDLPAAPPGRRHPQPPPPRPDHPTRQDPRRDRCRRLGCGRDAAAKGPAGCARPPARPVRLRPRRDPPPPVVQDRLVRVPTGRR